MARVSVVGEGACEAVVEGLKAEYGAVLAARILEAEAADFLWDARIGERYLGQHFGYADDAEDEHSRVAILSLLAGNWHVGTCLADGDGQVVALLWSRRFERREEAEFMFSRAA
ncbi:MAG: hypothetical protein B7Z08_01000 [Sphingomonadales bacterium 32-68-7]|nr:MAG: hypothetical protein B7Z33_03325 [Sphingomonadales bacterium 12-68-11]OYX10419.1 MAG: hypothetical protein B7Z08_01000 [Sphingomonadales bacterium 32-68-7]